MCFHYLCSTPLTGTPVESLALRDHVAHRPHGLLDGSVRVGAMAVHQVEEVEAEALERECVEARVGLLCADLVRIVGGADVAADADAGTTTVARAPKSRAA